MRLFCFRRSLRRTATIRTRFFCRSTSNSPGRAPVLIEHSPEKLAPAVRFRSWPPCFQVVTNRLSLCSVPFCSNSTRGACRCLSLETGQDWGERPFLLRSLYNNPTYHSLTANTANPRLARFQPIEVRAVRINPLSYSSRSAFIGSTREARRAGA